MLSRLAGNQLHAVTANCEERVGGITCRRFERLVHERTLIERNPREGLGIAQIGGSAHLAGGNFGGRRRVAVEQRYARRLDRIERLVAQRAAHTQEFLCITGVGPHGDDLLLDGQIDRQRRGRNTHLDTAVLLESPRTGHAITLRRGASHGECGAAQQRNKCFHNQFNLSIHKYNHFPAPIKI